MMNAPSYRFLKRTVKLQKRGSKKHSQCQIMCFSIKALYSASAPWLLFYNLIYTALSELLEKKEEWLFPHRWPPIVLRWSAVETRLAPSLVEWPAFSFQWKIPLVSWSTRERPACYIPHYVICNERSKMRRRRRRASRARETGRVRQHIDLLATRSSVRRFTWHAVKWSIFVM